MMIQSKTNIVAVTGGKADGLDYVGLGVAGADHAWTLSMRADVSIAYPVPYFAPNTANRTIGVDIFPSGPTPPADVGGGLGKAWLHIGDVDIRTNPSDPSTWAQMSVDANAARFGSRSFNGAAAKPVWWDVNGTVQAKLTAAQFEIVNGILKVDSSGTVGAPAVEVNGGGLYKGTSKISLTPDKVQSFDVLAGGVTYSIAGGANNFLTFESEAATALILTRSQASASEVDIIAQRSRGTLAAKTILATNDVILDILASGHNGSAFDDVARMRMILCETSPAVGAMGGRIQFHANAIGGTTLTEMLRLDNELGWQMGGANTVVRADRTVNFRSYTVGTVPAVGAAGGNIYVSNESGGAVTAFSDATNWRRVTDRAIVS